jgi:tetratricopeptide (TPR) repeat protein
MRVLLLIAALSVATALRVPRRGLLASALLLPTRGASAASSSTEASNAFQRGDYVLSEKLWREVANAAPSESLAWSNLGVTLIINASDEMQLGVAPSGKARDRLDEALAALDTAIRLDGANGASDALTLNSRGNALGLLLRWEEAATAYAAASAASRRDFESIPRSNEALALFELGSLGEAERRVRTLIRRDPNFRDGTALLAALRLEQNDVGGAASAVNMLCSGADGPEWCRRYSNVEIVLGRWSPRAVAAYRRLLKEPSVQLELRNAQSFPGR